MSQVTNVWLKILKKLSFPPPFFFFFNISNNNIGDNKEIKHDEFREGTKVSQLLSNITI